MARQQKASVVLASTSPRRIELLQQIGLEIEIHSPGVNEDSLPGEKPAALVSRLAREKAASVAARMNNLLCYIIAADTIVVAPDGKTILGKPTNVAHARKMLKMLAGKTHTVFTGYCIFPVTSPQKASRRSKKTIPLVRAVRSRVTMRSLTAKDIAHYVESGEPMDKAGSYAAQGLGMALIERIDGSYSNVVGLPLCQLAQDLEERFGFTLFKWKS